MAGEFGRRRWSGAVREAFLRGLVVHGSVRRACDETGMSTAGAYYLRRVDGEFAKLWDDAVARAGVALAQRLAGSMAWSAARAQARERGGGGAGGGAGGGGAGASGTGGGSGAMLADYRKRRDGWTGVRTRAFLRALSETGCVRDACMRVRISTTSAYRMRRRHAGFARAWERALAKAMPTLEQAAFERAVEGWDEIVWKAGVEFTRKRRYSDALLRMLIERGTAGGGRPGAAGQADLVARAEEAARAAGGGFFTPATREETNRVLLKQLDAFARRKRREAGGD